MTKHARQEESSATILQFPWMSGLNAGGFEAATRAAAACSKVCTAWQQEVVRFTTTRLLRDGEFGRQLLATRDWSDMAKLQSDWLAEAGQDYADEASRLAKLAQDLGAEMMRSAGAGAPHEARGAHRVAE